jgi:hypothetical protein
MLAFAGRGGTPPLIPLRRFGNQPTCRLKFRPKRPQECFPLANAYRSGDAVNEGRNDQSIEAAAPAISVAATVVSVVPRWQYDAFRRWISPPHDRDGVDAFVGRPLRAPGA